MKITLRGKENVYEQIVNEYKRFISLNVLKEDDKLPSCRELAKELGINPNTVSKAYTVLESEGYIKVLPKKGVYVSSLKEDLLKLLKLEKSKNSEIKTFFQHLKKENVSVLEIKKILEDVYGGEEND